MPSLKSRLFAFILRQTRKKSFQSVEGLHQRLAKARRTEDHRPPGGLAATCDLVERSVGGFPVYDVAPKGRGGRGRRATARRLLYLHGGAFLFEITAHHWTFIAELANRLDATVTVPIYPLAPEHDVHAVYGMMLPLYLELAATPGAPPLTVMGDSAGGSMALTLAMMAARDGAPAAARQVLISAGLDLTGSNPEAHALAKTDPWLDLPGALEAARLFAGDLDTADWRVSPLYGDLSVLPPTLAFVGTHDLLCPDTRLFAERAKQAGVDVELEVAEGMFHVWPLLPIPEARVARDRMVSWIMDAG